MMSQSEVTSLYEALRWAGMFVWVGLALVAIRSWRRRRDPTSAWLVGTFASLGLITVVARLAGDLPQNEVGTWITKVEIVILLLFPYCLFRFMASMIKVRPVLWWAAHLSTAVTILAGLAIPSFPARGEARSSGFVAFILLLLLDWVWLSAIVAWRLWRAGKHQPPVAARRMKTLGAGALSMALALVIAGTAEPSKQANLTQIITQVLSLISGPLFLVGFAPPRALKARWRAGEERALLDVQISLVKAESQKEIATALLPRVMGLVGGGGAALLDPTLAVLQSINMTESAIGHLRLSLPPSPERYKALPVEDAHAFSLDMGWLLVTTTPYTPFFGDEELGMLQSLSAMTDLALARARSHELQTQATEAMRDFVAIASHDLRTPVTVIQGLAQTMEQRWEQIEDERKRQFMSAIYRQSEHLSRLIGDLLMVSKVETGAVDAAPVSTDVAEIAREVVSSLAAGQDVRLTSDAETSAFADPDHVRRIIENYLRNAQIYGKPPIEIQIQREGSFVCIRVTDKGEGVPPDFAPRLFQKFARADKKKSKATQGTGLGLSIVKGLARANGGEVGYETGPEGGARFVATLPAEGSARNTGVKTESSVDA